jgi:hypothetical protein
MSVKVIVHLLREMLSLTNQSRTGNLQARWEYLGASFWRRGVEVVLQLLAEFLSLWSQARKGGLRSSCSQVGKQSRATD